MDAREAVLLAKAEKLQRELRHLVAALNNEMEPPLSASAGMKVMEAAALLGAWIKRWRFGNGVPGIEDDAETWPF